MDSKMSKIGILYICTGKYNVFWEKFYETSEKYFLKSHEKIYFVYSDVNLCYENNNNVIKINQPKLGWPYDTLKRFHLFLSQYDELIKLDFLFFFNANALFIKEVGSEILPDTDQKFVLALHPYYFNKRSEELIYERNPLSTAFVPIGNGEHYFQGCLNGGIASDYLEMAKECAFNIDQDLKQNIIAIWWDESHLNKFFINHNFSPKILDSGYIYPEDSDLNFEMKIVMRDKNKHGGHNCLRDVNSPVKIKTMINVKEIVKKFIPTAIIDYKRKIYFRGKMVLKLQSEWDEYLKIGRPSPATTIVKNHIICNIHDQYQSIKTFVETGTFYGDTINIQRLFFSKLYSIELSDNLFKLAKENFKDRKNVNLIYGDSGKELKKLLINIHEPCLFWLDGHYSEGVTAKADIETPILEELNAIFNSNFKHIILIDDARCFNGTHDYPTLEFLKEFIQREKPNYLFKVEDDIICLTPTL